MVLRAIVAAVLLTVSAPDAAPAAAWRTLTSPALAGATLLHEERVGARRVALFENARHDELLVGEIDGHGTVVARNAIALPTGAAGTARLGLDRDGNVVVAWVATLYGESGGKGYVRSSHAYATSWRLGEAAPAAQLLDDPVGGELSIGDARTVDGTVAVSVHGRYFDYVDGETELGAAVALGTVGGRLTTSTITHRPVGRLAIDRVRGRIEVSYVLTRRGRSQLLRRVVGDRRAGSATVLADVTGEVLGYRVSPRGHRLLEYDAGRRRVAVRLARAGRDFGAERIFPDGPCFTSALGSHGHVAVATPGRRGGATRLRVVRGHARGAWTRRDAIRLGGRRRVGGRCRFAMGVAPSGRAVAGWLSPPGALARRLHVAEAAVDGRFSRPLTIARADSRRVEPGLFLRYEPSGQPSIAWYWRADRGSRWETETFVRVVG